MCKADGDTACHLGEIQGHGRRRQTAAHAHEGEHEPPPEENGRDVRHQPPDFIPSCKTYRFFLLIENKEFTKIVSLTGNELETSGLLYSAMFCINQKNASFKCKGSNFFVVTNTFILKSYKNNIK